MELRLPLVLDGSTGTQLQKRGFEGDCTAEEWCIAHPEAVEDFQGKYIKCGSNILYTPTFGANASTLENHKVFGKVREFNLKLAAISKNIAKGKAYVAGDISPCGRYLYPMGDATFEDLYAIYLEQAAALEEAGVDLFVIETMVSLSDARAAILAVKDVSRKPVFVTFSCDETGKTMMGTDVVAALVICQSMGIDAFGLNCSTGPDAMLKQLESLSKHAEIPLIAKPNAGLPEVVDGKTVYNCPPEEFCKYTFEMGKLGVGIFGGCCGTTEEHIKALADKVKEVKYVAPSPKDRDVLVCANSKKIFTLPKNTTVAEFIPCDDNLQDRLEAFDDEKKILGIVIENNSDIQAFSDCEFAVSCPLCILSNHVDALEKALRVFQGRALYEGNLSEADLLPLSEKYGLIQ